MTVSISVQQISYVNFSIKKLQHSHDWNNAVDGMWLFAFFVRMVTLSTLCLQVSQQLPHNNIYKTPDCLTENFSSQVDVLRGYPLLLVLWFSGTPLEGRQPIANSCLTAHRLTKELKEEEKGKEERFFISSVDQLPHDCWFLFLLFNNKNSFEQNLHNLLELYLAQETTHWKILCTHRRMQNLNCVNV